jgi:ferredoxin
MRVRVDPLVCEANAVCVGLAPEISDPTDDEDLHIHAPLVPPGAADRVPCAVRSCPKAALNLEE